MRVLDEAQIAEIAAIAGLAEDHPLFNFTLSGDLQEIALGGAAATERLLRRGRAPTVSIEALRRARAQADETGRAGEELVAAYLERQTADGAITAFEWISDVNAVAPMDFRLTPVAGAAERVDVKTTSMTFEREFHVSLPELKEMAADGSGPYRIYRVFELSMRGAKLRISDDMKEFARAVLASLGGLPVGVVVDAVSVNPGGLVFGNEVALTAIDDDEEA